MNKPAFQELAEIGIDDLAAQERWVRQWNGFVRSGGVDGRGSQEEFIASLREGAPVRRRPAA